MPNAGRRCYIGNGHREPTLLRFAWQVVAPQFGNTWGAARCAVLR